MNSIPKKTPGSEACIRAKLKNLGCAAAPRVFNDGSTIGYPRRGVSPQAGVGIALTSFEERLIAEIPALRRYGRVLCREREAAEDLLQDCVERALRRRHLWRRPGNFRAWLFRIMHNIHANDVRWRARRPRAIAFEQEHERAEAPVQEMRLEIGQTLAAFEQLSDDQRQLLVLIAIEGFSYREAARILSLPEGTVMSRMSRARERLLDIMAGQARDRVRRIK